jgi:hypothetical protein
MKHHLKFLVLGMTLCGTAAWAQISPGRDAATDKATATAPVAYVYVSSYLGTTGVTEVNAFAAYASGRLRPVPGSPFADQLTFMAVNGEYLMGGTDNNININAYLILPDGAISFYSQTNIVTQNQGCGSVGPLVFDHTGASLYNFDFFGNACSNDTYEGFNVVKASGNLTFLGDAGDSESVPGRLSFIGNNEFAYGSTCYHFSPSITGFKRNGDGSLTQLSNAPAYPTAPSGEGYCPYLAAADPTNHVAIPMQPFLGFGSPAGPYQLAVYTADSSGNLTTTSTSINMPAVSVGGVNSVAMAPSGKILAVGGPNGLQVFHMNGANPITGYAILNTTDQIDEMFWDNANDLYAISSVSGKLFVYRVTPAAHSAAPGSPHTIGGASHLIVQPWPRY